MSVMPEKVYRLYLVRHGESIQNTHENHDGLPDHAIPLTKKGEEQAYQAGLFLKDFLLHRQALSVRMWVSPYFRTRQTARKISDAIGDLIYEPVGHGPAFTAKWDYREDDMLTELQFGLFNNIPKEEIKNVYPKEWEWFQNERRCRGKFFARRPGGESPFDCAIRQKLFLDTLYRDIQGGRCPEDIILVGHGAALNVLRKCIFHYSYEWYEDAPNPDNCSIQYVQLCPATGDNNDFGYIYGNPQPEKK